MESKILKPDVRAMVELNRKTILDLSDLYDRRFFESAYKHIDDRYSHEFLKFISMKYDLMYDGFRLFERQ